MNATLPKLTDNMFPAVPLHQVTPASDGSQFFAVIISEFPHNPYVPQWSLSVQRELAKNTTLEVNYVGNKGTHLLKPNQHRPRSATGQSYAMRPEHRRRPEECRSRVPGSYAEAIHEHHLFFGLSDSQWNGCSSYNAGNVKRRSPSIALVAV